ncbi:SAM-dependent methyltransferase [Streptomyces sp. V4I23]|uniref:methyltransferase domain-containing protein n=1 Tax=Streptomyces sp. V4I23 TaxID=3042282 RepID=UPI0027848012|nr:methyltransferase domain-containing protein [Streptomyces sp. V4I23]MDQ1005775.1 SAM-dependent methyltransferase [Streptomyces sp. V4I23]
MSESSPTPVDDASFARSHRFNSGLRQLREDLGAAGYTEGAIASALGASDPERALSETGFHAYFAPDSAACAESPLVVLTHLYVLNRAVPAHAVTRALGRPLTELLDSLHMLVEESGQYRGTVSLTPYRSKLFLSDLLFTSEGPQLVTRNPRADAVMPPHAATFQVLRQMERPGEAFLDVGCAGGFFALMLEEECDRVAGIDINPRAVAYAEANAALNGSAATFTTADIASFSPPEGSLFSDFLFNSPTVPRYRGRDNEVGQMTARSSLDLVVAAAPRILRPGGTVQVMLICEVPESYASLNAMVQEWLVGTPISKLFIAPLDSPHFTVTMEQLRSRRIHGRSLLLEDRADAELLCGALADRGVTHVEPALVRISL